MWLVVKGVSAIHLIVLQIELIYRHTSWDANDCMEHIWYTKGIIVYYILGDIAREEFTPYVWAYETSLKPSRRRVGGNMRRDRMLMAMASCGFTSTSCLQAQHTRDQLRTRKPIFYFLFLSKLTFKSTLTWRWTLVLSSAPLARSGKAPADGSRM